MATIRKDIDITTTPEQAWDALRDYGAVHQRVAPGFLTSASSEGDDRIVTFANGAVARERLVSVDDDRRRLVYAVVDSPLGMTHHQATVEVVANGEASCTLVWTADLLPDDVAPVVAGMMDEGAAAMRTAMAG